MPKSGSVSRQRPRSRPTTCNPASASSLARMVPLRPTPTTTASTGFNRVAMLVVSHKKHVLRVPMPVEHGLVLTDADDGYRQRVVGQRMLLELFRVPSSAARRA